MKGSVFKYTVIALFLTVLALPTVLGALSSITGKSLDTGLKGYFDRHDKPEFSGGSFRDSSFQTEYGDWFGSNYKPRGIYIKTYNTLRFNLFGKAHNIIGKDDYIFEFDYVSSELSLEPKNDFSLPENREKMEDYVYKLQRIQEELEKKDKKLLFYISTSKADLYHDYIPENYLIRKPEGSVRGVDYLMECLSGTDVNWFWTVPMAEDLPCESFYATGIHWSRPFEQKVDIEILKRIRELTGKNMKTWELTDLQTSNEPYFRDTDVFDMMNLWNDPFTDTFYQYDTVNVEPEDSEDVKILMQGGSFAIGFREDLWTQYPGYSLDYINYCEYYVDKDRNVTRLGDDWNNLPLGDLVENADILVIEVNEAVISRYSNGYVDALYEYLCGNGEG